MILVLTEYAKPIEEIEKWLPAHSQHLDTYYDLGKVVFSGRLNPRTGGIILFSVDSLSEAEEIIAKDPFKINGCANYHLIEFILTKCAPAFRTFYS